MQQAEQSPQKSQEAPLKRGVPAKRERGHKGGHPRRGGCQEWDSNPRLPGRLQPECSAFDRSAILTLCCCRRCRPCSGQSRPSSASPLLPPLGGHLPPAPAPNKGC